MSAFPGLESYSKKEKPIHGSGLLCFELGCLKVKKTFSTTNFLISKKGSKIIQY